MLLPLISVKLGQKDYDTAQRVLGNVFVLNILLGLAFTVIVFPFLNPILYFFGGSDETVEYARQFMEIILLGNVVTHLYLGLNAVLRASGHPKQAMYATIATVAINTILAPIFIFMFDWGIRGAAIATVSAQVIALLWQLKQFNNANELLHFRRGIFRLKRKIVFDSLAIGMSPFLDEPGGLPYCNPYQSGIEEVRRRLGYRCLWYCEPLGVYRSYDCDGIKPGNAAHCRI